MASIIVSGGNSGIGLQAARDLLARFIARGQLAGTTGELSRLIGRPTTPIADMIAEGLQALNRQ
ncbi:hypothetical protein ABT120_29515 [Nonomuraea angiospora]|uniref:hypothetical protein n=1 Tax=Nonomuraea angiospora TaxID=46172 RepID=UPI0033335F48